MCNYAAAIVAHKIRVRVLSEVPNFYLSCFCIKPFFRHIPSYPNMTFFEVHSVIAVFMDYYSLCSIASKIDS